MKPLVWTRRADTSDTGSAREDVEISVAFSLILGNNSSQSIIENGAQLNARGLTSIDSKLEYPLLVDDPASIYNPAETTKDAGLKRIRFSARWHARFVQLVQHFGHGHRRRSRFQQGGHLVIGAAFNLVFLDNNSVARVGAGVSINQDPIWQSPNQSVSVTTSTLVETVDVDQNAVINLSIPTLVEIGSDSFKETPAPPPGNGGNPTNPPVPKSKSGQIGGLLRSIISPFGISGRNVIGPSIIISGQINSTIAEIQDGAMISAGMLGTGVTVRSTQEIMNVAVAQTGGQASEFGLTASITFDSLSSLTQASIGNNVRIVGPSLTVDADDNVYRYAIDGAYVFGELIASVFPWV